jgi:hypothetical protein
MVTPAARKSAKAVPPLVKFRAGERASTQKPTGRSNAKKVVTPAKRGATVGDAMKAVGKFAGEVNSNIHGALKNSSPGLQSKGIDNVMKLPAKKKTR